MTTTPKPRRVCPYCGTYLTVVPLDEHLSKCALARVLRAGVSVAGLDAETRVFRQLVAAGQKAGQR